MKNNSFNQKLTANKVKIDCNFEQIYLECLKLMWSISEDCAFNSISKCNRNENANGLICCFSFKTLFHFVVEHLQLALGFNAILTPISMYLTHIINQFNAFS